MTRLLDIAIEAHGGWDRWQQVKGVSAHVTVGGALWQLKGWPGVFADAHATIDTRRPQLTFGPLPEHGRHTLFEGERVAIVGADGKEIESRGAPRQSFAGHEPPTPWDALHLAYFTGYAMWGYLTAPFLFCNPAFEIEELAPWDENGQIWRRLKVLYPEGFHAHCREQVFYFDETGLLRRNDYRVDIVNSGNTSAHYTSGQKEFGGIVFPTSRRVYPIGPDNRPITDRILVSIDIHSIELT